MSDDPAPPDEPTPPMLFDIAMPGEQARAGGVRLQSVPGGGRADAAFPPEAAAAEPKAGPDGNPGAGTPDPDALRREMARELARRFRSELDETLPDAMRDARRRIRRAVDDAMVAAVRGWHRDHHDPDRGA